MNISADSVRASTIALLSHYGEKEAAKLLSDSKLVFVEEDHISDELEGIPSTYVVRAELASPNYEIVLINDTNNPLRGVITEALESCSPGDFWIKSIWAYVSADNSGSASEGDALQTVGEIMKNRALHPDVLASCESELIVGNYFHALLEASKSVAVKIRHLSGLDYDGSELVNKAFGGKCPVLAVNALDSLTAWSDQEGFFFLVQGMFATVRNMTAHSPKSMNPIEESEALDFLSFISYLHRRLDKTSKNTTKKTRPLKSK